MEGFNICPSCFNDMGQSGICPHCGNDSSKNRHYDMALPPYVILNNRYILGNVLGKGGFGITYIAKDMKMDNIVAIKEYMPSEYSSRLSSNNTIIPHPDTKSNYIYEHGREMFFKEAQTLLKFRMDPIIVSISDYFKQNNTAYIVMEYLDGKDLRCLAKENDGKIDADYAKMIFLTVASSLMEVHKHDILHRDLSPENIIITKDGRIKIIDFGAARDYVKNQNTGMSILLKPGFAPPEQYSKKGYQGPWTDVYALCATFYNIVSGKPVLDASFGSKWVHQSLYSMGCHVTKRTSDVIEKGMALDIKDRYRNFKELLDDIDVDELDKKIQKQKNSYIHKAPYVAEIREKKLINIIELNSNDIFKIGRLPQSCHMVIGNNDTNISRVHCYLNYDGNNVFLTDVSANGTYFMDGQKLNKGVKYSLSYGTEFYLVSKKYSLIVKKDTL